MTGDNDPRTEAWAYLSRVVEGPCAALLALVEIVGVTEAARAVREWDLPDALRQRTEARRHVDTARQDLASVARLGGRLVTPDDDDWPAWRMVAFGQLTQAQTRVEFPAAAELAEPLALWVLGDRPVAELTEHAVAVVGARASSPYGERVTADIAGELAQQGWTIVSGAAYGIDAAAHRAALAVRGATIAVLATGVDRPYPAGHTRLLREIADRGGLVMSEYPPGTGPAKHRFLVRNRLVAACSDAVVVVEAGARSGARNTAAWARKLGRPALAVPGSVLSATSVGCHRMVRDGEAQLVTGAPEVLEIAGPLRLNMTIAETNRPASNSPSLRSPQLDGLSADQLRVYDALPTTGARLPREIAEESGLPLGQVRALLPLLELAGHAGSGDTGWVRIRT